MAQTFEPEIIVMNLTDALDYDPAAQAGDYLAVWDPSERSDVETDGGSNPEFHSFSRVGATPAAAQAATISDLEAENTDPASGTFRYFQVRDAG